MTADWIMKSMKALASRIVGQIGEKTEVVTEIPNLTLYRFDEPTKPMGYLLEPSLCVILQGAKRVILGDNVHVYDATRFFVTSIDLPLIAHILEASPSEPYVGMMLKLDKMQIAQIILDSHLPSVNNGKANRAIELGVLSKPLFGAIERLINLLAEPECIPALSPLIQKEILFRLLTTECGPKIREIATGGSHTHQISRVIDWIKGHLSERFRVKDLAGRAGMSVSTLHHHFRSLTALSPLQFQKHLRLNEARRLMLIDRVDAATAAFQVGYESPSQFSREYSRLFGAPPLRYIKNLTEASNQRMRQGDRELRSVPETLD